MYRVENSSSERGSAMLVAVLVLFIVTAMGGALLFTASTEIRMSQASVREKQAFFFAEAGLESGRATLYNINGAGSFDDDLLNAAGPNGLLEFDPANLVASWDASGNLTGLSGYGDDRPLTTVQSASNGWYAAFLTNDAAVGEGASNLTDGNDRVMITGVGAGPEQSLEITEAVVLREEIFPTLPPAAITLLGPSPVFRGPTSNPKEFHGDDCMGAGIPGLSVPVVGTIGDAAEAAAEAGINPNPDYTSGALSGADTFANLLDPTEPSVISSGFGTIAAPWTDCQALREMVETTRLVADVVCYDSSCVLPPSSPRRVVFVDGDYELNSSADGEGLLVVTGQLSVHGQASWRGLLYVIGEGRFVRYGSGNGLLSGATITADIAGPDDIYGTADDCTGGDNGFAPVLYDERGGGNSDTAFCTADFLLANPVKPYRIVTFRQH